MLCSCDGGDGDFAGAGVEEDLAGGVESCSGGEDVVEEENRLVVDEVLQSFGDVECASEISESCLGVEPRLVSGLSFSSQGCAAWDAEVVGEEVRDQLRLVEAAAESSGPVERDGDDAVWPDERLR